MVETRSSLIHRVRDPHDAESWQEFVSLYEPLLLNYVRKQGLAQHDACDVVQEIFTNLLRAMPSFELNRNRGRFRTWLWRIMHNTTIDWLRRRQRTQAGQVELGEQIDQLEQLAQNEPDDDWVQQQRQQVLQTAMQQVKGRSQPRTWACFELHLIEQRPSAEVADQLGLTQNSVYVNSSRVLSRVRAQCAEYMEDLADE